MKKLTKITFTVTIDEAETLRKAIGVFEIACKKTTGVKKEKLMEFVTPEQLEKLTSFGEWLTEELADLEAWNAEVDHFEAISATVANEHDYLRPVTSNQ